MQIPRRALNSGLVAGIVIVFLVLIGLPGGASDADGLPAWFAWGLFGLVTLMFAFFAVRPRNMVEERTQTRLGTLNGGVIVGIIAAALIVMLACALNAGQLWERAFPLGQDTLPSGLRNNITRVQDVFSSVTPRTTAVLAGLPLSEIDTAKDAPRTDPTLRFFLMGCLLPIAGLLGGAISSAQRSLKVMRANVIPSDPAAWRAWLPTALTLLLFAFIIANSVLPNTTGTLGNTYKNLIGANVQLAGLLASFLLVAAGLLAVRAASSTTTHTDVNASPSSAVVRLGVPLGLIVILFGIGLFAPIHSADELTFSQKAPNLTQITNADGTTQVVTETVTPIEAPALYDYRRIALLLVGALFVIGNLLAARRTVPLRILVTMNVLLATLVITPLFLDRYQQSVLLLVGINILLGLGLNIVVGYAGLLDLGYVAFYAIGAYVYAFLSSNQAINVAGQATTLKFGGNDQSAANMAAALVIGIIVVPIVMTIGLTLWRRRSTNVVLVRDPRTGDDSSVRPAWLGYALVIGSVAVTLLVITLLRNTPLYASFAGFPVFVLGILAGVLCAATAGVLLGIPVLRLRGDYLAIVTLGFGEIIRLFLNNLQNITGGPQGLLNIPHAAVGNVEMGSSEGLLYIVLIGCLFVALLSLRLKASRLGRAWGALRSDEDIAQAMGVNIVNAKVLAFAIGAAFAGVGGVIFAARQGSIFPDNFTLSVSINVLSLIIIGGMGSIPGVIVGALVLVGVPESLRVFENYRIMAFGALLIAMMLLRPAGLLPQPPQPLENRARLLAGKEPVS